MTDYRIETFRPHLMSVDDRRQLVEWVRPEFTWYAPDSTDEQIDERLSGNGKSFVDVIFGPEGACGFALHYTKVCGGYLVSYRAGSSIREGVRGEGLYRRLLEQSLAVASYDYLATRTQNRVVYSALRGFAPTGVLYPSLDGRDIPPHVLAIARACSEDGRVVEDSLVVRDAHGFVRSNRSFMESSHDDIERFFAQYLIGPDDGFMVVVPLK